MAGFSAREGREGGTMARGIFRLRLPDGTVRLARGTPETGPTDLLPADATVESLLRAGSFRPRQCRRRDAGDAVPADATLLAPIDNQEVWARRRHLRAIARRPGWRRPSSRRSTTVSTTPSGRRSSSSPSAGASADRPSRSRSGPTRRWNAPEPEFTLVSDARSRDRRLHDRQRRLVARDRGREPALPAAGEDLRRLVRDRAGDRARERGRAAGRDPAQGRPRRRRHRRRGDIDRPPPPDVRRHARAPRPGAVLPARRVPAHRDGHRRRLRVQPERGRRLPDRNRRPRSPREPRRVGRDSGEAASRRRPA